MRKRVIVFLTVKDFTHTRRTVDEIMAARLFPNRTGLLRSPNFLIALVSSSARQSPCSSKGAETCSLTEIVVLYSPVETAERESPQSSATSPRLTPSFSRNFSCAEVPRLSPQTRSRRVRPAVRDLLLPQAFVAASLPRPAPLPFPAVFRSK